MLTFPNISIKNKLVLMQVMISVIVLGLLFTAFLLSDIKGYKERKIKSVSTIAQVMGSSASSSLLFADNASAEKNLSELKVQDDIANAIIFDKRGNVFASYTRQGFPAYNIKTFTPGGPPYEMSDGYLLVNKSIEKDKETLGTVLIRVDLTPLNEIIKEEIGIGLFLLLFGVGLSFLIALFVQSYISRPLLSLVNLMQSVISSANYKNRAEVRGQDEISQLSVAFNDMLGQIEKRDNEMEMRVKERTSELEAANKELESFSYSVSHDMRAPLRAVGGFSNILLKHNAQSLDEDGKDALNMIASETARMGQLIDDLLAFSRTGKKEVQKARADMNRLAADAMKEVLNAERGESKAQIIIDNLPDANCDSVLMRQVFVNLFSNAIKYSGHAEKPLVHIGAYSENGKTVYFVKDNGVGFDMTYYNKLFGVFQRLHSQPEFKGTGIGLAIVQKIVKRHGGNVWAEAKVGKGATFYFSLPK